MTPRPGKIPVKSFRVSTRSVPRFEVTADARPPPARASPRPAPPARAIDAQSFPPPFPIVSQGSPRSRARPHPPARRREIPRARRVGFRCRTSSRRVRASRVAPFRATFDASVRDLSPFDPSRSRARESRGPSGARGVAECRARVLRLGRRAVSTAARAPSTRADRGKWIAPSSRDSSFGGGSARATRRFGEISIFREGSRRFAVDSVSEGLNA